jgi:hypothetical protein
VPNIPTEVSISGLSSDVLDVDYRSRENPFQLLGAIDNDLEDLPYVNSESLDDADWDLQDKEHVSIVYIENFFTDGRDFAYYILGRPNLTAFQAGMFGMQAYNGPLCATPIMSYDRGILEENRYGSAMVKRSHGQMERVKWKYLYETARIAWSKLLISPQKLEKVRSTNALLMQKQKQSARDWEVQSVTSVEARDTGADMGARRLYPIVEEPSTLVDDEGWEEEFSQLLDLYEDLKKNRDRGPEYLIESFARFVKELYGETSGQDDTEGRWTETTDILHDVITSEVDLARSLAVPGIIHLPPTNAVKSELIDYYDHAKRNCLKILVNILNITRCERGLPTRDEIGTVGSASKQLPDLEDLSDEQSDKVEQLLAITGGSKESSLRLLVRNYWDIQTAVVAHFDGVDAAEETESRETIEEGEIVDTISASPRPGSACHDCPDCVNCFSPSTSGRSRDRERSRRVRWAPNPTVVGPSGIQKLPKLTAEEEEAELVAAREWLARLIQQIKEEEAEDGDDKAISPRSEDITNPIETEGISVANMLRTGTPTQENNQRVYDSIETTLFGSGSMRRSRPAFQTALDIIGSSPTRKRRESSAKDGGESPPKKQRGSTAPEQSIPQTSILYLRPKEKELTFEEKLDLLRETGLADDRRCLEVLFEQGGHVERALKFLQTQANTATTAVPSQKPTIVESDLLALRDMGFLDDRRNAHALNKCYGNIEEAVDYLVGSMNILAESQQVEAEASSSSQTAQHKENEPPRESKPKVSKAADYLREHALRLKATTAPSSREKYVLPVVDSALTEPHNESESKDRQDRKDSGWDVDRRGSQELLKQTYTGKGKGKARPGVQYIEKKVHFAEPMEQPSNKEGRTAAVDEAISFDEIEPPNPVWKGKGKASARSRASFTIYEDEPLGKDNEAQADDTTAGRPRFSFASYFQGREIDENLSTVQLLDMLDEEVARADEDDSFGASDDDAVDIELDDDTMETDCP